MIPHQNSKIPIILIALALIIITAGAYCRTTFYGFITYDDPGYVSDNPSVLNGLTTSGIRYAFTTSDTANRIPLTWLSLMLDCQIAKPHSPPQSKEQADAQLKKIAQTCHSTNLLFHLLNTLLLFLLLERITHARWCSACAAALFALHPLHVESVAWISERKDVLSTFFWLLTMWTYQRYARRPRLIKYIPILLFFILGFLAKPMLVTLPFVLLLIDYWPLKRFAAAEPKTTKRISRKKRKKSPLPPTEYKKNTAAMLILEKLPLFILTVIFCIITFTVQQNRGAVRDFDRLGLAERFTNAMISYCSYLGKMVFPWRLGLFYPYPTSFPPVWQWAGALVILIVITLFTIKFIKRPYLLVGWLWFLGTMVPVIGLVQVGQQAMADRYTYIPLIGLFIALTWGFADWTASWRHRKYLTVAAALIILAGLTFLTWRQAGYWRDSITLFQHSLAINPGNHLAHNQIGYVYAENGDIEKAIEHHRQALKIKPNYTKALVNLGRELVIKQEFLAAIDCYRKAIQYNPKDANARNGLGAALLGLALVNETNDFTEAEKACRAALEIDKNFASAHLNLASIYFHQKKIDQAVNQCRLLLQINPNDNQARNLLQKILSSKNENR